MPSFANWLGGSLGADLRVGGTYVLIHLVVFVSLHVMAGFVIVFCSPSSPLKFFAE